MEGFKTPVILTYKAKANKENKRKDKNASKREKKNKKDDKKNNRSKDKTLSAIGKSTGEDVCSCIRVFTEYVKEAIKLVLCAPTSTQEGDKFGPMFCELGDITIRLLHDAFNFIKYLVKSILSVLN